MGKTKIEWADVVWNPTIGCTKLSAGCKNCYAERIFNRFHRWPRFPPYERFSEVRCYPEKLDQPLHWKKPRRVFVDSMSDLFHEDVSSLFIDQVFETMHLAWWHTFIILTKRAVRMWDYISRRYIPNQLAVLPNVWLLTSIEDQPTADGRIPWLLKTPAAVRGISVEPMLEKIDLSEYLPIITIGGVEFETWIDWVICGGESGPKARPMQPEWAQSLRDQCQTAGVPFYFKQWGEWYPVFQGGKPVMLRLGKKKAGRMLDGKIWDEMPAHG